MGIAAKKTSLYLIILTLFMTLMPMPKIKNDKAVANDHPWADSYGFEWTYPSHANTYGSMSSFSFESFQFVPFSGIYESMWNRYPSTHYCLSSRSWSSSPYYNTDASVAYRNLRGNVLFSFFGHAYDDTGHMLAFRTSIDGTSDSYILDKVRGNDSQLPGRRHYLSSILGLDDMKFALLLACRSACDFYGDGCHLAFMLRCYRGVDIVVGFNDRIAIKGARWYAGADRIIRPAHVWNTEFWRAS